MNKKIFQSIKSRRISLGLSQKEAGLLAGMPQQQYQSIEAGKDVRISTLLKIMSALSLDLSIDVLKRDEDMPEDYEETPEGYEFMNELLEGLADDD